MGGWEWRLWWWQCFIAWFLCCYVCDPPMTFVFHLSRTFIDRPNSPSLFLFLFHCGQSMSWSLILREERGKWGWGRKEEKTKNGKNRKDVSYHFSPPERKTTRQEETKDKIELQSSLRFLLSFSSLSLPLNSVVSSFPDFWYYLLPKWHLVGDKQKQAMPFVLPSFLFFSFDL